eukprot:CAMPEP_0194294384 /NCGR_PEP_ID=MMETSP0169-20130528/50507_1 /TAXON_ID=218684 /ORGANISM="Corethron pennatum, Strain L29A3" /LENGTH=83 /DNA_ID=CAMNT_0039043217 /DNA_START=505 /DNA_END=753 /DNA_ORIENTATION=-
MEYVVAHEESQIVEQQPACHIAEDLESCWCRPARYLRRASGYGFIPDVKGQYVERELEDPEFPVPFRLLHGWHALEGVVVKDH